MRNDPRPDAPRRHENGSLDLDFYIRRAHRLRSEESFHRIQTGTRFLTRAGRHDR